MPLCTVTVSLSLVCVKLAAFGPCVLLLVSDVVNVWVCDLTYLVTCQNAVRMVAYYLNAYGSIRNWTIFFVILWNDVIMLTPSVILHVVASRQEWSWPGSHIWARDRWLPFGMKGPACSNPIQRVHILAAWASTLQSSGKWPRVFQSPTLQMSFGTSGATDRHWRTPLILERLSQLSRQAQ